MVVEMFLISSTNLGNYDNSLRTKAPKDSHNDGASPHDNV